MTPPAWTEYARRALEREQRSPCPRCHDTGAILNYPRKGEWIECDCPAGVNLSADLDMGIADIAAGRTHKWSDVRREL